MRNFPGKLQNRWKMTQKPIFQGEYGFSFLSTCGGLSFSFIF